MHDWKLIALSDCGQQGHISRQVTHTDSWLDDDRLMETCNNTERAASSLIKTNRGAFCAAAAEESCGSRRLVSQLIIQIQHRQLLAQQQRNEERVFVAHCWYLQMEITVRWCRLMLPNGRFRTNMQSWRENAVFPEGCRAIKLGAWTCLTHYELLIKRMRRARRRGRSCNFKTSGS